MKKTEQTHINTTSGGRIDLLNPDPAQFTIHDISVSLGRQCRFNGNILDQHYSVAQHSVYVSHLVPPQMALAGLLHDASEMVTGDIVSPVKRLIGPMLREIEDRIQAAVHIAFGLPMQLSTEWQEAIHAADMAIVIAEKHQLLPYVTERWDIEDHFRPANIQISMMDAHTASAFFLERFWRLTACLRGDSTADEGLPASKALELSRCRPMPVGIGSY